MNVKRKLPKQDPARAHANYLTNTEMLAELKKSKAIGQMTPAFANMLILMVKRYGTKGNFVGYTYNADMQGLALLHLSRTWASFDETRFVNCFAYYTQCIKASFLQYLKKEKAHQLVKDSLMVDGGMMPSYSFQLDHSKHEFDPNDDNEPHIIETQHKTANVPNVFKDVLDTRDGEELSRRRDGDDDEESDGVVECLEGFDDSEEEFLDIDDDENPNV